MKVLNKEELQRAEEMLLKHTPGSLLVYSPIYALNRNKPSVIEVLVDTWPDFKVIISRPDPQKVNLDHKRIVSYYCMDEKILRKMVLEENVVDFSLSFVFGACDTSITEVIKEISPDKGVNIRNVGMEHLLYLPDCSTLIRSAIDSEFESRISSLNLSHVELVNQNWKYGGNEKSYKYITHLVIDFPSCCITDDQGQPVSWIIMQCDGAMGMLYTVPEHRGKGYAKVLIYTMAKRLLAEGFPVWCLVVKENLTSYRLFKSMGFIDSPYKSHWFRINW